jgi:hypothetical protein
MRKSILAAGIAAAALIPSFAFAQSCEEQRQHQSNGTVAGAVVGGAAGAAVAGRHDRLTGALIGGTLGAIIGNQTTKPEADCRHAYGYYDGNGMWHANSIDRADARGYFDRNGAWVEGPPNGYYDSSGRWVSADTDVAAAGYYDRNGRWVPASSGGYYDADGRWVSGVASGYYDGNGRWIAGPVNGHYDAYGRWIPGSAAGHYEGSVWVADAAPGYYDAGGRWHAGQVYGYYDARGRWVPTASSAGGYGADVAYTGGNRYDRWRDAPRDVGSRETWLDARIRADYNAGRITRSEANANLATLADIRRQDRRLTRRHRGLTADDEVYLQRRLDDLADQVRQDRRD